MTNQSQNSTQPFSNPVIHYALQLLALAGLLLWCFQILQSFFIPLIWGAVLAITLYPLHKKFTKKLRNAWSATLITIFSLSLIIGPAVLLMVGTVDEFKQLVSAYRSGELDVPLPDAKVKDWPIIGDKLYEYWSEASINLGNFIGNHSTEVKSILLRLFELFASTGKGIIVFTLSIIISGVMLAYAEPAGRFARNLLVKLAGKAGEAMSDSAALTVRNVAKGILGVATIQTILAGIGFVIVGIPFAGLWILVCLILAIVQIGLLPVSVGVIIYIWGAADTLTATLFTIWMIFVGIVDNILKPIMLGKGAPAPMLVVFLGAIGGFMATGFIGLFLGAIILTLGYNLLMAWLMPESPPDNPVQ